VAKGDYKQHVDFMGEFSDAFNTMVKQLADRQEKLENEILAGQKHAKAMEQSNQLLSKLAHYIPEQIFVVSTDTHEILHINDVAKRELDNDPAYITNLISLLPAHESQNVGHYSDVRFTHNDTERYLVVNAYHIEWLERNATALVVNDVSIEKKQMKELEDHAYRDGLTQVYNRFFGMLTLNEWVDNKKRFALVFVDLDNLKYINDNFGHNEGDGYIIRTAGHLQTYSNDAIICRLGGDEFMLLVPDTDFDEAHSRMEEIQYAIQHDKYLLNKDFYYSISLGIVAVGKDNNMSSSDILSIADERMYEHKRVRKMERKNAAAGGR
jgi:diguanylate cyclase (GGDEF)-like protein